VQPIRLASAGSRHAGRQAPAYSSTRHYPTLLSGEEMQAIEQRSHAQHAESDQAKHGPQARTLYDALLALIATRTINRVHCPTVLPTVESKPAILTMLWRLNVFFYSD
jgi:hypothetical protein